MTDSLERMADQVNDRKKNHWNGAGYQLGTRITATTRPGTATTRRLRLEAGHDCYGRYRHHRRIQNTMFTEAGPDSEHSLGKVFADVKAGFRRDML